MLFRSKALKEQTRLSFQPSTISINIYNTTLTQQQLPPTNNTTATMSSPYTVQIHQSTKEPSISSSYSYSSGSYSSSTSTTPRSLSPGDYREYGADKHTTQVASSGRNLVINHNKVSYEKDSPAPKYSGAYTRI